MLDAPRLRLALAGLAAAALAGCMTPHVEPKLSQAVIDARSHRDASAAAACPQAPLTEVSPVVAGFGFDESQLTGAMSQSLGEAAQWLACHAGLPVVVKPDADSHGTDAEQDALARRRAEAVRQDLIARGVPADRIRLLNRGEAEPAGEHFLVRAEGRRW